jgi:hypothetical protein
MVYTKIGVGLAETYKGRNVKNYDLAQNKFVPTDRLELVLRGNNIRPVNSVSPPIYSNAPGDRHRDGEKRWSIQFVIGPSEADNIHATIYCNPNDVSRFKDRVRLSLRDQTDRGFVPENTLFNPGDHDIDHIFTGFAQGVWRIRLDNEGRRRGEIRFSERDFARFRDWLNE